MLWGLGALAAFVIAGLVIGPNLTSQHAFYRERLAKTFLNEAEDRQPEQRPPMESHQPQRAGGPYPLFGGAVSCGRTSRHPEQLEAPFERFLMSPQYCGSATLGYFPTACLDLTLADAVAISGAALTPNYFVHHIVTLVMSLLNLRLGKWLRNPRHSSSGGRRPSLLRVMYGDNLQEVNARRYVLVTDGGHVENLGLGDLLERRCRLIIVSDAGSDEGLRYADFSRVLRRYRREQGIEFLELDGIRDLQVHGRLPRRKRRKQGDDQPECGRPEDLCDGPSPAERRHFFFGRIRYPGKQQGKYEWGLLVYVKPCLTGDEPADVCNYALDHEPFPHESTADQTFSDVQFEAYRVLGYHTGRELCAAWRGKRDLRKAQQAFDLAALVRGFTQGLPDSDQLPELLLAAAPRRAATSAAETATEAVAAATAASPLAPGSTGDGVDARQPADEQGLREKLRRVLSDLFDAEQRPDDVLVDAAREQKAEIFLHLLDDLGFTHSGISDRLAQLLTELDEAKHGPFICTLLETLRRLGDSSPAVLKAVERKCRSKVIGIAAAAETTLQALQKTHLSPPVDAK